MGIKSLWSLLESAGESMPVDQMKGMKVAIDASMWAHRIVAAQKYGTRNQPSEYVAHLEYFTRNILKLLHYEIQPVFVFDGPAPMLKGKVMKRRRDEEGNSSFSQVAMRLLRKSTSKKSEKAGKLFKSSENQSTESKNNNASLAWFIQNKRPSKVSIAEHHLAFEVEEELPFNTKKLSPKNREPENTVQYRGQLPNSNNPTIFSEGQMNRFIEAVSFDTEKRLYAENKENAFRMMHIPKAVSMDLREQGDSGIAEKESQNIKLKKDMMGLVRGQKDTFFYIGPISNDQSSLGKKTTIEASEVQNLAIQHQEIELTSSPKDLNLLMQESDGESSECLSDGSAAWSSEEENIVRQNEFAETPSKEVGNAAHKDSYSSANDAVQECVTVSPKYSRDDLTERTTLPASDPDERESVASRNEIKSDEDEWMEIQQESGERQEASADEVSESSHRTFPETEMDELDPIEFDLAVKAPTLDEKSKAAQPSTNETLPTWSSSIHNLRNSVDFATNSSDISKDVSRALGDLMTLCTLFGIPILQSPGEAEAQCAVLNELGLVDAVVTDDSDVFLFGAKCVIRNFFHTSQAEAMRFDSETIETKLGFDRIDLLILGFMLGGDYMEGIKGIGLVKCLPLLAAFRECQEISPHTTEKEGIRQCVERSLMNLYHKTEFFLQRVELQEEYVKLFKKPSAGEEDVMKALLLAAEQSAASLQDIEIQTTTDDIIKDGFIDLEIALDVVRMATLSNSITKNAILHTIFPDMYRHASDSSQSFDKAPRTDFGIRYILDAYLSPNVHLNLNTFACQVPAWPKLLRYLHDRCGNKFSHIQANIAILEKRYREIGPSTTRKAQITHYTSLDRLLGTTEMHLEPKLRKLLLTLQSIRKEAKGDRIPLSQFTSWITGLVPRRKRSPKDSS